jgi:hypothetical protein
MGRRAARAWVAGAVLPLAACVLTVDVDMQDDGLGIHGNGVITTDVRDVGGYRRVSIRGSARLTIERTGHEGVRITTDENLLPLYEATVRGGTLYLGPRTDADLVPTEDIEVVVETEDMEALEASGAVAVHADIGARPDFSATLSGATLLGVTGDVDHLTLVLSGAGSFDGREMDVRRADVTVSGACQVIVRVTGRLVAWASGVSLIRYIGNPALEVHVSGTAWIGPF